VHRSYCHFTRGRGFGIGLICLALAGVGCSSNVNTPETKPKVTDGPVATVKSDVEPLLKSMGTLPAFSFTDQDGQTFGAEQVTGKLVVLNFIFTQCQATCPQQSLKLRELQKRIETQPLRDGIRLLSISVDPEHDTPEALKTYAAHHGAVTERWKFLTGTRDEIWKFSREGLKLLVQADPKNSLMPIAHDAKFVLIDRRGHIRGYFDVLGNDGIEPLWKALSQIAGEFTPPAGAPLADATHLAQPPEILNTEWLERVRDEEASVLKESRVRRDFRFESARADSEITFQPQIVDDQRWRLIVNHYDHGNSVSVADVDGDGKLDLYFVAQVGPNELWRNLGNGQFENITEKSGTALVDRVRVAAAFADIDNDGDADLFVTSIRGGNVLLINDGTGQFTDRTKESGLEYVGHSSTGVFFDYDRDGRLDLFVSNVGKFTTEELADVRVDETHRHPDVAAKYYVGRKDAFAGHLQAKFEEPSLLYHNVGDGKFVEVGKDVGIADTGWNGDAMPLDINSDGWQDLYVLNMQGRDHLYINREGKHFEDQTDAYFPQTPWGTMGAQRLDFDGDGRLDLFLTDMHSDMSEDVGPDREKLKSRMQWPEPFLQSNGKTLYGNAFFAQTEPGKYTEISDRIGAENYWPWGLSAGDLNADGWPDAIVTSSMCFPYRYGVNSLLLNDGGKRFVDAQFAMGIEPRPAGESAAPWFVLDADGGDAAHPMCKGRKGRVVVWSARGSRSSVLFDMDDDGDLDIVTNEFNTPPQIFRSTLSAQQNLNWMRIKLEGKTSNRDGLGAVVLLTAGGRTQTQVYDGKSGYLAQSRGSLYFGLGEATNVDRIEVQWPSGTKQTMDGPIAANAEQLIVEPAPAVN
jgi:enediyne biosynthesis protein E4